MRQKLSTKEINRLNEIKAQIEELVQEAASLVRGTSEEQRASHWHASVCTALDKDHTQGDDSTITMQETIDALTDRGADDSAGSD